MDCEQVLTLLVAHMDRELPPEDLPALEAHLNGCAPCRATAEALQAQDAQLRRVFAPRRRAATAVAERVILELRTTPRRTRRWVPWVPMLISAAAGFLLAMLLFRPWDKPTAPEGPPDKKLDQLVEKDQNKETLRLAVATAAVEFMAPNSNLWQTVKTGGDIVMGCRVRTGPRTRCEFHTNDGSEVRLNNETELVFRSSRNLELGKGQIMAKVAHAPVPFQVAIPQAVVTAVGTEFDLLCKPVESVLTVLEGTTQVKGRKTELVQRGIAATISDGEVKRQEEVRNIVRATLWINDILYLKGPTDKEFAQRVDYLLEQVGFDKTHTMSDIEIRALGSPCVPPLLRYMEGPRSQNDPEKRQMAARIVADLAQPWSIPNLIELLKDKDREVRCQAARGLQRLTQDKFKGEPEGWSGQIASCENAHQHWLNWWEAHRYLCPGDLPHPSSR